MRRYLLFIVLYWFALAIYAIDAKQFDDAKKQSRYDALIYELRCPVCQNQNLADSNAPLAEDLRDEIFNQINSGKTDKDIIDFMVLRYGDFIQYRPALELKTLLLWIGPIILLLIGIAIALKSLRKQSQKQTSAQDNSRLEELLDEINTEEKH